MLDGLLSRVEDASLNASAPPQQRWLDGWLLRFSPGKAKRARCINAVADGRLPLAERLHWAAQVYAEAGLPMMLRVTPFTLPAKLPQQLAAQGWRTLDDTRVMLRRQLAPDTAACALPLQALAADDYAQLIGGWRGSSLAQRQAHAQRLKTSPVTYQGVLLHDGGQAAACGQYAVEGNLVGLYDVFTAPEARGRGIAGRLCQALLARAQQQGAQHAYLQVEGDNHAARAVYHRLGLGDAYRYHYLTPQAGEV